MQIERFFYPVQSLGLGSRIGIWTLGCPHECFNCSNPELWEEDEGKDISIDQIFSLFEMVDGKIDGLTITGGEPFKQPEGLLALVTRFKREYTDDILVYSGYTKQELIEMNDTYINDILDHISVLIDGKYIDELNDNAPLRGSSNQQVHILNRKYEKEYAALSVGKRQVQNILNNDEMISIGIPVNGYKRTLPKGLEKRFGIKTQIQKRGEL